jgi:hypothetical protein
MAKTQHLPNIPCEEEPGQSEGVVKGGVVGLGSGVGIGGRPKRKGSGKKGVWMEMLLLQPSLKTELCIGKAAQCMLCFLQRTLRSAARHSLYLFLRLWESTIMLTSLISVTLSENDPQWDYFRFLILSFFF